MTEELANYILGLNKYVVQNGENVNTFPINIEYPLRIRMTLSTPDDLDQNLIINIQESERKAFKISLHHQDNNTQNGLLRIDYNGRHLNPAEIIPSLPKIFIPFAGKYLDDSCGHIHYVVNGYRPLAWAIPLELDDFPIKKLVSTNDYVKTLQSFFQRINLKTNITFNQQMRAL